jgi:hypothetical protein
MYEFYMDGLGLEQPMIDTSVTVFGVETVHEECLRSSMFEHTASLCSHCHALTYSHLACIVSAAACNIAPCCCLAA